MVKKVIVLFLAMVLVLSCGICGSAKTGDVIGTALNTDIVAYINHYAVPSFAVNGQSVIVAEDLVNFGFDVRWDQNARALYITRNSNTNVNQMNVDKSAIPGTVFAHTLETEIRVFAEGKQITSYAINGYTMIPIEELNMFGTVNWVPEEKAIKLWVDGLHVMQTKQEVQITRHTLYNLALQEVHVLPGDVEAYKAVGWYDYNDFICEWANKLVKEKGYDAGAKYLKDKIYSAEFAYGQNATQRQWATLDAIYKQWYGQLGIPMVITDTYVSYNSSNTPIANIGFWNISGKEISSVEVDFVCYDAYGRRTTDYSIYNGSFHGWVDNADHEYGEEYNYYWTLYSNSRTKSVRNIVLTKVAFADGTYWYR